MSKIIPQRVRGVRFDTDIPAYSEGEKADTHLRHRRYFFYRMWGKQRALTPTQS
jgi:hypothetical protein